MKVWRLFSGTVSILLFFFILLQSSAVGMANILNGSTYNSGSAGVVMAFLVLVAGIISIALWADNHTEGDMILTILFYIAFVWGLYHLKGFGGMIIYTIWAFICSVFTCHENEQVNKLPPGSSEKQLQESKVDTWVAFSSQ